jgi:glycosyl transferase family 87
MAALLDKLRTQRVRPVVGLTLVAIVIVLLGRAIMPWDKMFPDFISFWAAGKLVAEGASPYDVAGQIRVQQEFGWQRAEQGFGVYDFLPYYYPPWLAVLWTLLLPLGYEGAKLTAFFLNVELLLLSAHWLRSCIPLLRPCVPMVLVPCLFFSVACVLLGQSSVLILFLIVASWKLLLGRRDFAAGAVLALLTIKPQLSIVLLAGVGIWALRWRHWRLVGGFLGTLALLVLASSVLVPNWLQQMLQATSETVPPTEHYPWIGNSWFLVVKALGFAGTMHGFLYPAGAIPFIALVLHTALRNRDSLGELLATGTMAAFFVAPYARHYDFVTLLVPILLLIANRLPRWAGLLLGTALLLVPYGQLAWLVQLKAATDPESKFVWEGTFFWVPLAVAMGWFITAMRTIRSNSGQGAAAGS